MSPFHNGRRDTNEYILSIDKLRILTGIWMKLPLFMVGYESKGTTGTEPFFMKIGP